MGASSCKLYSVDLQLEDVDTKAYCVSNSIQGLVCHNRLEGCIFSHRDSACSQEVPGARFWGGGEAYQYHVLPFGLVSSPRTFTKWVRCAKLYWPILDRSQEMALQH